MALPPFGLGQRPLVKCACARPELSFSRPIIGNGRKRPCVEFAEQPFPVDEAALIDRVRGLNQKRHGHTTAVLGGLGQIQREGDRGGAFRPAIKFPRGYTDIAQVGRGCKPSLFGHNDLQCFRIERERFVLSP